MVENSSSLDAIARNLETRLVGQRVIYYPSLTSTMEAARQAAQRGAAGGTVVIAGEQTAGKGRIGRTWLSPKGSLALSVILYPSVAHLHFLIMLASLAVVHSIKEVTGLKSQIKWPNDVLINGKKVCGILVENGVRGNTVDYAIIGIGVNVNLKISDFPEILSTATSLSHELGKDVSLPAVARQLLAEVDKLYLALPAGGPIYEEWRNSLATLGETVRVKSGANVYEGIAETVASDGSLLLRQPDSSLVKIASGDVTLRD